MENVEAMKKIIDMLMANLRKEALEMPRSKSDFYIRMSECVLAAKYGEDKIESLFPSKQH